MSAKLDAYVAMSSAVWDAVDARQKHGAGSRPHLEARLAMLVAKRQWLKALRPSPPTGRAYAVTAAELRAARRRCDAEIRETEARLAGSDTGIRAP